MESKIVFTGIDVSASELVCASPLGQGWEKHKIANTAEAINGWLDEVGVEGRQFILEATGTYSDRLIHVLHQRGAKFSVVNPAQSSAMSKVLMKTNKTDGQDAQTLSLLGQKLRPQPYTMPSEAHKRHKEILCALSALQKQERQLKNQLHAFEQRVEPCTAVKQALQNVLDTVLAQIEALEKELAPQQDEEQAAQMVQRIKSIKGVGQKTAQAFVAAFGDFQAFQNAKQFAQFLGIAPAEFSSGKTVRRKSSITKRGWGKLRALLFNCARSAIQYNPHCEALFLRLVEKGKHGSVAFTAVMHKIARLIFGVAHSDQNYDLAFSLPKTKN